MEFTMKTKIVLDQTEEKIRQTLVSFASEYTKTSGKEITLRITGGWVRDKLLERPSHDIDIAIDSTTGEEFASALQTWLKNSGCKTHSVHTIARNPEKSKHLETATTKLYGLDIDFVNLRSEKYTADSRIPLIEFGTPVEDALRRDATLNALFYNLEKQSVEDFTGRGLEDLKNRILRTPLDPVETFRDDPLRILRLIRFVAQLDFDLAPEVYEAMGLTEVAADLSRKVSRERVGVELDKLVRGDYAPKALHYLANLGLTKAIFTVPEPYKIASGVLRFENLDHKIHIAQKVLPEFHLSRDDSSVVWMTVLLDDNGDVKCVDVKNKEVSACFVIIKEGVKLPTSKANLVRKLLETSSNIWELRNSHDRSDLGFLIRNCGSDWQTCFAYTACIYDDAPAILALQARIFTMELDKAYELKPILRGKQVMDLFPGRAPGSWLNRSTALQLKAQMENPTISEKEITDLLKSELAIR